MAVCSIVNYKDHEILYFNYSGLSGQALLDGMKEALRFQQDYPGKPVLSLTDFTNVKPERAVLRHLDSEAVAEAQKKDDKQAVVGLKGLTMKFLKLHNKATGSDYRAFKTMEEAMEYLIS
jgi:hypothetical protein